MLQSVSYGSCLQEPASMGWVMGFLLQKPSHLTWLMIYKNFGQISSDQDLIWWDLARYGQIPVNFGDFLPKLGEF